MGKAVSRRMQRALALALGLTVVVSAPIASLGGRGTIWFRSGKAEISCRAADRSHNLIFIKFLLNARHWQTGEDP